MLKFSVFVKMPHIRPTHKQGETDENDNNCLTNVTKIHFHIANWNIMTH